MFYWTRLAQYKYPRWFEFIDEFSKTATGKIRRYKLHMMAQSLGSTERSPAAAKA